MKIRVSPKLIEPFLWADAVLAGGSVRRAVRNYVGDDPDRRENGLLPLHATGSIARGLWRERTIRQDAFIKPYERPLFIAGSTGRSGTTWLMDLLGRELKGNHVVIREVGLFDLAQFRGAPYEYFQYANLPSRAVYRRYFREFVLERAYFIRRKLDGTMLGLCDLLPRRAVKAALDRLDQRLEDVRSLEDIEQCFGQFYIWLFNCHAELVEPGRPWISKEPPYGRHADQLLRMMPDARVVILVRDGRDVAASMFSHGWHATLRDAMDRWRHFTFMTAAAVDRCPPESVLLVRYADLIHDFERQIASICSFLDIPLAETPRPGDPLRPSAASVGRWKATTSDADRDYFARTCGELMDRFGLPM
jgi:hypothetical protein